MCLPLAIVFLLKTMESLLNGIATRFQATPWFSMRTELSELHRVSGMHQWTRIRYKQGPPELQGHSAVKVADGMVVYGGESNGLLQGDIWKYHFGKSV